MPFGVTKEANGIESNWTISNRIKLNSVEVISFALILIDSNWFYLEWNRTKLFWAESNLYLKGIEGCPVVHILLQRIHPGIAVPIFFVPPVQALVSEHQAVQVVPRLQNSPGCSKFCKSIINCIQNTRVCVPYGFGTSVTIGVKGRRKLKLFHSIPECYNKAAWTKGGGNG